MYCGRKRGGKRSAVCGQRSPGTPGTWSRTVEGEAACRESPPRIRGKAAVASVQARERDGDALERLGQHLHKRELKIFPRRLIREIHRRTRRLGTGHVKERANLSAAPVDRMAVRVEQSPRVQPRGNRDSRRICERLRAEAISVAGARVSRSGVTRNRRLFASSHLRSWRVPCTPRGISF
jgi:hypothetical protein